MHRLLTELVPRWLGSGALVVLCATAALGCCCHKPPHGGTGGGVGDPVPLETKPLDMIEVEDAIELDLLQQELGLQPVLTAGRRVYFRATESQLQRLPELGFTLGQADANELLEKVVLVRGGREEKPLREAGVHVLRREKDLWVARGTIRQLRALRPLGYRLEALGRYELRPRSIKVIIEGPGEVGTVTRFGVDVYTEGYEPSQNNPYETTQRRRYAVWGGAFDDAIEALRAKGYTVEVKDEGQGGAP